MPENKSEGCENNETCCLCLPLKTGVTILAILSVFWGAFNAYHIVTGFTGGSRFGVFVALIPSLIADFFFLKWLMDDNKENRDNLPRAALLNMFSIIAITLWTLCLVLIFADGKTSDKFNFLIYQAGNCCLSLVIWYYYLIKLKIFASNL